MSVFNALVFDGINSLDYGVYITGEAVFNSPQRSVEAVTVPGRNGDVLLDLGRYENIEVTYHAGVFGADQSEFATKIRTFRNLLASRVGYKRITDTYNPNEYRMGTFIASVDVTPTSMDRHGEFDIVFNCKPQRFLTSGETAITVTNGNTVTNPTLFDSQPLLRVKGYGEIAFNGYNIVLNNEELGYITAIEPSSRTGAYIYSVDYRAALFNPGDSITLNGGSIDLTLTAFGITHRVESVVSVINSDPRFTTQRTDPTLFNFTTTFSALNFTDGTPSTITNDTVYTVTISGVSGTYTVTNHISIAYTLTTYRRVITITSTSESNYETNNPYTDERAIRQNGVYGISTASVLGDPTTIDCEFGEAYRYQGTTLISLNEYIDLGSDLPTLAPGNNTFALDNTITELKVTPRYWIL